MRSPATSHRLLLRCSIVALLILIVSTSILLPVAAHAARTGTTAKQANTTTPDEAGNYQINAAHTGSITTTGLTLPLATKWSTNLSGSISYPLIANGKVFAAIPHNGTVTLSAIDEATGKTSWSTDVSSSGQGSIGYDAGVVYVINYGGVLAAFNANTGAALWAKQMPGQYAFSSPPTARNGMVYVGGAGSGGTVYGVRASDGKVMWTGSVENGDNSSPVVTDDGVYVAYACNQIYKFDPISGTLRWHYSGACEGGGGDTAVFYNGNLYTRDFYGDLILNGTDGTLVGTYAAGPPPAFDNNMGFYVNSGNLRGVNPAGGTTIWTATIANDPFTTAPIVVNGIVYAGTNSGVLYAYDETTGTQQWHSATGGTINGLSAAQGLLVVGTSNALIAYSTPMQLSVSVQPPTTIQAGATFTVEETMQDTYGNTLTNYNSPITLAIKNGTGTSGTTLNGTTTVTAVNGVAKFNNLTLNTVGTSYVLTATSSGVSVDSTPFDVVPGAAAQLVITAQPPATTQAGAAFNLTVTAHDAYANTVSDYSGSIAIAIKSGTGSGGATLAGTTPVNTANGIATFNGLRIDKMGAGYVLAATSVGLTEGDSAAFTVTPGPATQLAFSTQPQGAQAGQPFATQPVVLVEDAYGNSVSSQSGSVSLVIKDGTGASGATLSGSATVNFVAGMATFTNLNIDKAGTGYVLSGTSAGLTGSDSQPFAITSGQAAQLMFTTQPFGAMARVPFATQPVVTVQDSLGNIVTAFTGSVTLAIKNADESSTILRGTTTVNAVAGIATFTNLSIDVPAAGYVLTATTHLLTGTDSQTFAVAMPYMAMALRVDPATIKASKGKTYVATLSLANHTGKSILKGTPMTFAVNDLTFKAGAAVITGGATIAPSTRRTNSITATLDSDLADGTTLNLTLTVTGKSGAKTKLKATLLTYSSNSVSGVATDGSMQMLTMVKGKTGLTLTGVFFANNEPVTVTISPAVNGVPSTLAADANGVVTLRLSSLAKKTKYTVTITGQWSGVTSTITFTSA